MKKKQSKKIKHTDANPAQTVPSFLNAVYRRTPALPFFDKPSSALLLFCIAAFVIFTAFVFFTSPPLEPQAHMEEAPLAKNAALSLLAGEQYAYSLSMGNQSAAVYYSVSKSPSCAGTLLTERDGNPIRAESSNGSLFAPQKEDATRELCLSQTGNLIGGEKSDFLFGNGSTVLFSPWMLAASENFSWKVEQVFTAGTMEISFPTYFTSKGLKKIAGRDAFAIGITSDEPGASATTMYIDSEKRVLLSAEISNVTIRLVQAPFALDWGNGSNISN